MRTATTLTFLTTWGLALFLTATSCAQNQNTEFMVRPIDGARMVVGDGPVAACVMNCFLHLCDNASPDVVVVCIDGKMTTTERQWKKQGAGSVWFVESVPDDMEPLTLRMLNADGVFIGGDPDSIKKHALLLALLRNVAERNKVIAVGPKCVSLLADIDQTKKNSVSIPSVFEKCQFHFGEAYPENLKTKGGNAPVKVHWLIPDSSALVIHEGRRVAGYGEEPNGDKDISVFVSEANGWPQRSGAIECIDAFESTNIPSYSLDLCSWIRSATDREQPVFPPKSPPAPKVENGTLLLHGGSKVDEQVIRAFIKAAGGKDANFVCIPSASSFESYEEPRSYGAGRLRDLGCENVTILHTADPLVADQSDKFIQPLKQAQGVWIDGGRTFRFMDSYQNTRVQKLLQSVLDRDGIVGGSSAGAQVVGDFLVRGNPRSNRDIVFDGYTRGLGLIKGVIVDAHFLQRGRHEPFLELMEKHPQMLGIGIDESTALIVNGTDATVLGSNSVSFYDLADVSEGEFSPIILQSGETYDLKRKRVAK